MSEQLLHRALRPTLRRLREISERVSEGVGPMLVKIGEHLCDPEFHMFRVQREAEATDWHVRLFKRELGIPPGRLALYCKVDVTLWLLGHTRLSVREIARLVGYKDRSALRKLLRQTCRFTPAEARSHLGRVRPEYRALGEELGSWYFSVRYHRGEVGAEELRRALAYLKSRFGSG